MLDGAVSDRGAMAVPKERLKHRDRVLCWVVSYFGYIPVFSFHVSISLYDIYILMYVLHIGIYMYNIDLCICFAQGSKDKSTITLRVGYCQCWLGAGVGNSWAVHLLTRWAASHPANHPGRQVDNIVCCLFLTILTWKQALAAAITTN